MRDVVSDSFSELLFIVGSIESGLGILSCKKHRPGEVTEMELRRSSAAQGRQRNLGCMREKSCDFRNGAWRILAQAVEKIERQGSLSREEMNLHDGMPALPYEFPHPLEEEEILVEVLDGRLADKEVCFRGNERKDVVGA